MNNWKKKKKKKQKKYLHDKLYSICIVLENLSRLYLWTRPKAPVYPTIVA